jgi:hypothetical protein
MKLLLSRIFIAIILLGSTIPVFAQQNNQFFVTALPTTITQTTFTAPFRITNPPPQNISFYAWVGQDGQDFSQWTRNILLATMRPSSPRPFEFAVEFNFQAGGFVPGVKYSYALTDRSAVNGAIFFNTPGSPIRECFTTTNGKVPCGADPVPAPLDPNAPVLGPNETPDPIPGPLSLGGLSIVFPPSQQEIYETSALIAMQISTTLKQDISLTYTWGKSGEPLANRTVLVTLPELLPGQFYNTVMTFNDLEPNTSYSFAIKNEKTNQTQVRSFKTVDPNAATQSPSNVLTIDPNSNSTFDPGPITAVEDTISSRGIVPRCGRTPGPGVPETETRMCGYKDFLQLISNLIQYVIIIIGPIVAIIAMYSGFMIIWLGKDGDPTSEVMSQLRSHKATLVRVAIGIGIMLGSFTIVALIFRSLGVDPTYILLDIIS